MGNILWVLTLLFFLGASPVGAQEPPSETCKALCQEFLVDARNCEEAQRAYSPGSCVDPGRVEFSKKLVIGSCHLGEESFQTDEDFTQECLEILDLD